MQPRRKAREFSRREKARGKAKTSPKTSRKARDKAQLGTKARRRVLARERRTHPRVEVLEKERRKKWRQDRRKIERSKTFDDPVIHLFSNLMEGATMQEWLSLFDFQITRRHIYYYNHATRCVDQPCQSAALWPVLWVLARFHPRRIWCGKSSPNMDNFKASLNVFANRNRWRWFIRDTPRQQFSICVPPHGKTKVCTHPAAPPLDTWISKFKRCLTEVSVKSSRTASHNRSFCNKIFLVNVGLEFLSQSGLEAVANDKGGGYSLVDPEVLTNIHLQMFGNGQYFDKDFTNWDRRCAKASMSYSILV